VWESFDSFRTHHNFFQTKNPGVHGDIKRWAEPAVGSRGRKTA